MLVTYATTLSGATGKMGFTAAYEGAQGSFWCAPEGRASVHLWNLCGWRRWLKGRGEGEEVWCVSEKKGGKGRWCDGKSFLGRHAELSKKYSKQGEEVNKRAGTEFVLLEMHLVKGKHLEAKSFACQTLVRSPCYHSCMHERRRKSFWRMDPTFPSKTSSLPELVTTFLHPSSILAFVKVYENGRHVSSISLQKVPFFYEQGKLWRAFLSSSLFGERTSPAIRCARTISIKEMSRKSIWPAIWQPCSLSFFSPSRLRGRFVDWERPISVT